MTVVIFIKCSTIGCDTIYPTSAQEVAAARIAARLKGWESTQRWDPGRAGQVTDDHCPAHLPERPANGHRPADLNRRITRAECTNADGCWADRTPDKEKAAVYDWCGHDGLGHRMANIVLREGVTSVKELVDSELSTLLDMRGFGAMCVTRWELFKEADRDAA